MGIIDRHKPSPPSTRRNCLFAISFFIFLLLPPLRGKVGMGGMDKHRARELRKNLTDAERVLWRCLRFRQLGGYKFRRQQGIGKYIVDFICLEKRLIVEVDGGQHLEQMAYDSEREDWLKSQGFRILRFWDNEVMEEAQAVTEAIIEALVVPPPQSSPARGEEAF